MGAAILGAYLFTIVLGVAACLWAVSLNKDLDEAEARVAVLEKFAAPDPDDLRVLIDRIDTFGRQIGKLTPLGAHSDLCERVAELGWNLRSLADRHAEFTAAVAESIDALKGRIVAVEAGKSPE